MPNKYEQLDALLLRAIAPVPKRFSDIYMGKIAEECSRLAELETGKEPLRVMDRRLQALRKAGKIRSTSKGWVSLGVAQ